MESEATATYPVGGGSPSPWDISQFLDAFSMEDLLCLDESAGHAPLDPQSAGDTSHSTTIAGLRQAVLDPYSTGDTSRCASTAGADTGSSSLDQEVNDGAGLPQSGGGGGVPAALTEAPVGGSCKRKKLARGSSSQRSTPPEFNLVELLDVRVQSDPSSADIKPPTGSTEIEIMEFLTREEISMPYGKEVNLSLAGQDQMAPNAARSYVTTVNMMPDRKTHLGYWKEKDVRLLALRDDEWEGIIRSWIGLKRIFQFHRYDGTKTNWFMHEYITTGSWGWDVFMKDLRFRQVYQVPGEPTTPQVKTKNKIVVVKHRKRGPGDLVIKGESAAWQHFIKIYDRHPELEGSKVVYAVCCHCEGVLKAGTENGTKSLLTHRDRTCPVKNKKQQPSSSSYQENPFGIPYDF